MRWHKARELRFATVPLILVIEDDQVDQMQIRNVLGQSPMIASERDVKFAKTIAEAESMFGPTGSSRRVPDQILLDLNRPDGDCSTFQRDRDRLEGLFPNALIHAISGLPEEDLPPGVLECIREACASFTWKWNISTEIPLQLPPPSVPPTAQGSPA